MSKVPSFPEENIERLARLLGDCGTGSEINGILNNLNIRDDSGQSTKWRRLDWIFKNNQREYQCANQVCEFIRRFLSPVRFIERKEEYESILESLNVILAFSGLEYGNDGKFRKGTAIQTLDEAEKRVRTIRSKFRSRNMHPQVDKYCRAELMQDNYFHAILEATKGLMQRVRDKSGIEDDGAVLVDKVFSIDHPILAFNSLRTLSEKSEHKGFAMLLKGCFSTVRTPTAHEPKIFWTGENNVADYLSLISLLHRKLDDCVSTNPKSMRKPVIEEKF